MISEPTFLGLGTWHLTQEQQKLQRLEDSIDLAKRKANHKYDKLITLMKDQGQKLDHTTDNHEAQIRDIKKLLSSLMQQLKFVIQRFPLASRESSQRRDKHATH